MQARLQRRSLIHGGLKAVAAVALGDFGPPATARSIALQRSSAGDTGPIDTLNFKAIAKSRDDAVSVPPGYTATVLLALGDPLHEGVPAYANDGSDTRFDQRSGDCHDGIQYFGLSADGRRPDASHSGAWPAGHQPRVPEQRLPPPGCSRSPSAPQR